MRLTVDLLQQSLSFLNPLKERELDLRGHKIPVIENLAVAQGQDAIDFTDNDLSILSNFPLSPRLRTLLLARNRINQINPNIATSIPNLSTLILTSNSLSELADLDPLSKLTRLTHLTLLENPVARKENYRLWILYRIPSVRFLDYQKVRDAERAEAKKLFGTAEEPTPLAQKVMGIKSRTFDSGTSATPAETNGKKTIRVNLTAEEKMHVQELIKNAKSLQEIAKLEKALAEGRIPGGPRG